MRRANRGWVLGCVLWACLSACAGGNGAGEMDAGRDAITSGDATLDGPDASGPIRVACGSVVCESAPVSGGLTELAPVACCASPGVCGLTNVNLFGQDGACFPRSGDSFQTAQCPGEGILSGFHVQGCCRSDAQCGLNLGDQGLGCLERTTLAAALTAGGHGPVSWSALGCSEYPAIDASVDSGADSSAHDTGVDDLDGGHVDSGSQQAAIGACDFPSADYCIEFHGDESRRASLQQECSTTNGIWSATCTDNDLIAECLYQHGAPPVSGRLHHYPNDLVTETGLRNGCEQGLHGTFHVYR